MIKIFNEAEFSEETEVYLMPEFVGWIIEAVPTKPYDSIQNAEDLLSCEEKFHKRRKTLQKFLRKNDPNLIILVYLMLLVWILRIILCIKIKN